MKNNYKLYSTLLIGLLSLQGTSAQTLPENLELTKQVLTFGDWKDAGAQWGVDTENIATEVKDFFYNNKGKLVKTLAGKTQLGDDPVTLIDIEKFGDVRPTRYTSYNYDENDRLISVVECDYEAANGWFFQWSNPDTTTVFTYQQDGKLATKTDKESVHRYTWEGEHLLVEKEEDGTTGQRLTTTYFYDFVAADTNLPKKEIKVTADQAFYIENEYDGTSRLSRKTQYALTNPQKDAEGNIIDGEKGQPIAQTASAYDEAKKGFVAQKEIYENGTWKAAGDKTLEIKGNYDLSVAVADITVDTLKTRDNSVTLTFPIPENTDGDMHWHVYRNGICLGEANFFNNQWEFIDLEAANGAYDYYVMGDTVNAPGYKAISNVVSLVHNAKIKNAQDFRVFNSGKDEKGYVCHLTWEAPQSHNTILGYNLYLNDSKQPVNDHLLTMPFYELHLSDQASLTNKIAIEIVYREGYALAAPVEFSVNADKTLDGKYITSVQRVVTFGNSEGSVGASSISKEDVNYYNSDNELVMTVSQSRLLGDDPDTPEVENAGDIVPTAYQVYDYNEQHQLLRERSREFGVFSGYDKAWSNEIKVNLECVYDEKTGKLIERHEKNKNYQYTWEGDQMITEASFNSKMAPLGLITYSDFSDAGENLPRYALGISKFPNLQSYNRVYEFEYDEKGRITAKREFKHGENVERDQDGVIIKADKGTPVEEEIWIYEGDHLKTYQCNKWKSSVKALRPYSKKEFTLTATGLREENYTYNDMSSLRGWTKSNITTETMNNAYYGETAPGKLTATDTEDAVNSFRLSCAAPTRTYGNDVVYQVYRNGKNIGEAKTDAEGQLVYDEKEVPNGTWHYLIKPATAYDAIDFFSTNVVEKTLATELPVAENVQFPVNGVKDNGDFQLVVTWDAPKTDLNIIGYNVYTDIRSYTKNPSPVNGVTALPADTRSYEFNWASTTRRDKTVAIEVVYNIGKIKTENFKVELVNTPLGIEENAATSGMTFADNVLHLPGNYQSLSLYAANGTLIRTYAGVSEIQLGMLPTGVYIARLNAASGSESFKIVKK